LSPQILGIIPLPHIRKFLRWGSPQIENPQIYMTIPQIDNLKISTNIATVSQNSHTVEVDFVNVF
jgi:hypothetical protein